MTRNYELVYYVAQNVGIRGILAYPKNCYIYEKKNREQNWNKGVSIPKLSYNPVS